MSWRLLHADGPVGALVVVVVAAVVVPLIVEVLFGDGVVPVVVVCLGAVELGAGRVASEVGLDDDGVAAA